VHAAAALAAGRGRTAFEAELAKVRVAFAANEASTGRMNGYRFADPTHQDPAGEPVWFDLDWNRGSSTRRWGFRPETRVRAPPIDAVISGQTPALVAGKGRKPDLLPGHPDFAEHQRPDEAMADLLAKWAGE